MKTTLFLWGGLIVLTPAVQASKFCKKTFEADAQKIIRAVDKTEPKQANIKKDTVINNIEDTMDQTVLKPQSTRQDVENLVDGALLHKFKAVCVSPCRVPLVKNMLDKVSENKHKPLIATVIGFPTGSPTTASKVAEAKDAYKKGADELDMVINVGSIKDRDFEYTEKDIRAVVEATPLPVKVILETGLLTEEEIVTASQIVETAGAHFVKTSTGFSEGVATVRNVRLMRASISDHMEIKASGGMKDLQTASDMLVNGANRLGLSAGVPVVEERDEIVSKR